MNRDGTRQRGGLVLSLDRLEAVVRRDRAAGRAIVMAHGCFDLLHPGHVRHLQFAASLGDRLIVTVTADGAVCKGPGRPVVPEGERAATLATIGCVAYVAIDTSPTAVENIRRLRPDTYVKGREYEHSRHRGFLAEKAAVEACGGRVVFSPGDVVFSSTALLEAMRRGGDGREPLPPGIVVPAVHSQRMKNGSGWESNPPGT
ncbi:MAG: adenylyltransferase/cytidyltransferase family protein [Planctomycetota bacterium]|nr:adenylyltransferase/cytidyltransferase family protein [Planctomycetota bacterium]